MTIQGYKVKYEVLAYKGSDASMLEYRKLFEKKGEAITHAKRLDRKTYTRIEVVASTFDGDDIRDFVCLPWSWGAKQD